MIGDRLNLDPKRNSQSGWLPSYDFPEGFPSGGWGLYSNSANVKFDKVTVADKGRAIASSARWDNYGTAWNNNYSENAFSAVNDEAVPGASPMLLRGVRADRFEATFAVYRQGASTQDQLGFFFDAADQDHYKMRR
ncbi:MAG: hypothetical protein WD042_16720 [Phycisphaeraceae bacterium]